MTRVSLCVTMSVINHIFRSSSIYSLSMLLRYTPSEYVENSAESKKAVITTSEFRRDVNVENQLSNRNNKSSKEEQRSVKP